MRAGSGVRRFTQVLRAGCRIPAQSRVRRSFRARFGRPHSLRGQPAFDQVGLAQLEGPGLALDALLGVRLGEVPALDDEAPHPSEVEGHERCHEALEGDGAEAGCDDEVVDDPRPQLVGEVEAGDGFAHLVGADAVRAALCPAQPEAPRRPLGELACFDRQLLGRRRVVGREHRPPGVGQGHPPGPELGEEAQRVHLERARIHPALEAVGRDLVAALDLEPRVGVAASQPQDRPDDLAEHRPEISRGVLRIVDLGAQARLADGEPAHERVRGHPDVDPELADLGRPVLLGQVVADEVAGDAEVAADRLADPAPVEGPGQRVGDGVRDRAVVLVAGVERCHVVEAALEDGPGEQLDPFGGDRAEVGIDDHEGLGLERGGDLEDGAQGGALAAHAIDLGVGEGQALEAVRGPDEQDPLDVVRRLGLGDHALGPVGRAGVGVDEERPQVREVLDEAGLRGASHVPDRRRVLEARDADDEVDPAEAFDLRGDRGRQNGGGHGVTVSRATVGRAGMSGAASTARHPRGRVNGAASPRPRQRRGISISVQSGFGTPGW